MWPLAAFSDPSVSEDRWAPSTAGEQAPLLPGVPGWGISLLWHEPWEVRCVTSVSFMSCPFGSGRKVLNVVCPPLIGGSESLFWLWLDWDCGLSSGWERWVAGSQRKCLVDQCPTPYFGFVVCGGFFLYIAASCPSWWIFVLLLTQPGVQLLSSSVIRSSLRKSIKEVKILPCLSCFLPGNFFVLQVSHEDSFKSFDPAALQDLCKVVLECEVGRWPRLSSFADKPKFLGVSGNETGTFPDTAAEHTINLMRAITAPRRAVGEILR